MARSIDMKYGYFNLMERGRPLRVEDLHHQELLELDPDGGFIRFAGQRPRL